MSVKNASEPEYPQGSGVRRRSLLIGGATAAMTASTLVNAVTARASSAASAQGAGVLKAGAGKAAIAIPSSLLPLDGFTAVHDDLYVRVLLLESGSQRAAMVVLDLTSISEEAITDIRTAVTAATGITAQDIVVTVTHTFSAPHVQSASASTQEATWIGNITAAAASAVADAAKTLRPARVGYGTGTADVNVNRNVLTAEGWWLGTGEAGPSDKSVGVARFDDQDGNPIAILINYNVQSSVMMDSVMANGDLPISADLAGAAVAHVEAQYSNDVVGFFLVGACGDQQPAFKSYRYTIDKDKNWSMVDAKDAGWLLLTVQGERLGTEVVRVSETITPSDDSTLRLVTDTVTVTTVATAQGQNAAPTTTHTFTPNGTAQAPAWVLRIGDGVLAGAEPELSTETALAIKKSSPFEHTFVMSMLEGGAKNMADKWNYEHITYEALDSSYAEGAAEKLASRLGRDIESVRK
ncbi:hypothetical protein KDK95_21000 [Actinospica sp. MGRD01-02]|uniref:Neutral/alkaline non-lysosomal ceramidase N-terminal domain-containing protein n=1 Tax=Actinospica acidithermotolerans TaxID=2828514 RepID=A0A941E9M9_9ACTN|nr:hypothetical protein [Actinospica acidithermotolerans]MBR7828800.1 hypothetical protein [Actinospica acidithermotolerans]